MKRWSTLLAVLATASLAVAQDTVIRSTTRDLQYDENDKLAKHYLLYPADGPSHCPTTKFRPVSGFESRPVADEALRALFPRFTGDDCQAVCVERGVDRSVSWAAMPHKYYQGETNFAKWFEQTCVHVEVCLMNYYSKESPIRISWLSRGQTKFLFEIPYGESNSKCFDSFISHTLVAEDSNGNTIEEFKVEFNLVKAFGTSPPSDDPTVHDFPKEIENTLHSEWKRHQRVTRTFSPLGFKLGRLPPDVFASMGALFYNNRWHKVREEWKRKGVFVNWWETDCSFIQIPWALKELWQIRLRELVEAWAGVPVEQTSMYGLRQYETGARLLTHVDRHETHAVSLIVNVAQGNMTEPWPVEVQDHADRIHEVIMEPGDVVYYESAKCLHGRNRPLKGNNAYYVNLFTHYRPVGDEDWFRRPNHEGTPEPLLDVEGTCRLEKVGTTHTANHQLGVVEAVQCDDERLGPFVSPSLFQANGPEDLIEWWRMTGPNKSSPNTADGAKDEL